MRVPVYYLMSDLNHERKLFVLTQLELTERIAADHSLRSPERIQSGQGRACTAAIERLSERASSNIALLYGGILSGTPQGAWTAPQQPWSS